MYIICFSIHSVALFFYSFSPPFPYVKCQRFLFNHMHEYVGITGIFSETDKVREARDSVSLKSDDDVAASMYLISVFSEQTSIIEVGNNHTRDKKHINEWTATSTTTTTTMWHHSTDSTFRHRCLNSRYGRIFLAWFGRIGQSSGGSNAYHIITWAIARVHIWLVYQIVERQKINLDFEYHEPACNSTDTMNWRSLRFTLRRSTKKTNLFIKFPIPRSLLAWKKLVFSLLFSSFAQSDGISNWLGIFP